MEKLPFSEKQIEEEKFIVAVAGAYRLHNAILNTTELCIYSTTTQGIITHYNTEAERLLGYKAEEIIGKKSLTLFHDGDEVVKRAKEISKELGKVIKPGFGALTEKAKVNRTADRREWTYIKKDGESFPVLLSVVPLHDENNQLLGFNCIATDITEIKKTEAKIKQSQAHLHALITSLDDVVAEVNKQGTYLNLWSRDEKNQSTSHEHYINKNISEVLGEELAEKYEACIHRVIVSGKPEHLEYKSVTSNRKRWKSAKFSFVSTDHVLICIRDITEQKRAELQVIKSEEKFRALAENIPGIIYLCKNDATYSMLYLNDKVEDLTGYPASAFISGEVNFPQLYHPDDAASIYETVDKGLANRASFYITYRIRHLSGEWRWAEEVGTGVYHNKKLLYLEGFISDVTAKKQAEEKLQVIAEENYRLFNHAVNLSVIASFDGYFKRINPAWSTLFGWSEKELLSNPFFDFLHPDDIESTRQAIEYISLGNNLQSFENRYRCKDGSYKWLLWGAASDSNRKLIYASAVDISARKKNEEQLIRSKQDLEIAAEKLLVQNRLLDEFAHIISHNLRSPIGNIQALIGLLNNQSNIDDYQLVFDKLKNLSKNLGETMNELMDTIKVKAATDIKKVEIRFKELLDKVVQSLEGEMIQSGALITFNFNAAPKVVFGKAYLESIFQNLLTNAIKYKSPDRKPEIYIESTIENARITLRVTDNGLGIDLARFGDKLFGLHKTFHAHKEAKGVGLFLTKTQIEALGGTIAVESEVNKGSTFIITF